MAKSIEPKLRKIGAYLQLEEGTIFTIRAISECPTLGLLVTAKALLV